MVDNVSLAATGIAGLDNVLAGGLSRGSIFLLEGEPGTGKTTVAMQFLLEGARLGEKCLYVTLSETEEELRHSAASHGWTLGENIIVFELIPPEAVLQDDHQQSLLYASDLELGETSQEIFAAVEKHMPARVVLDSLSEIRLLAQNSLRYRRQILAIKHFFARHNATVLMLDDLTADTSDKTVHSVVHGVIRLEEMAPAYGAERRRLRVHKYRGMVTDLAMPGMNGVELTALAREYRPGLPVLLATGYAELPSVRDSGLPRLGKPYEQAELKAQVDKLLQD